MQAEEQESRRISRALLIAALHPDSRVFAQLAEDAGRRVDWSWVFECAAAHKVAALLAARVEGCGAVAPIDDVTAARLRKFRDEARARAVVALDTLREVGAHFDEAGLPFLVVKGSVLAEHVYHDAAARRFFDVDVVVHPEMIEPAEALLRSMGYELGQVDKLIGVRPTGQAAARMAESMTHAFYRRYEYELPFVTRAAASRLAVDLHWHIAPRDRVRISAEDIWQFTAPVRVGDSQLRTLTPSATLIHLAVHATTCSFAGFRLLHLCDVAWAATQFGEQCDDLWAVAEAWGVASHLDRVMDMTARVLGVPLPPLVRRTIAPGRRLLHRELRMVVRNGFLVDAAAAGSLAPWRRAWREVVWSIAMRCLGRNLMRSWRVRGVRLRWWWRRRRVAEA